MFDYFVFLLTLFVFCSVSWLFFFLLSFHMCVFLVLYTSYSILLVWSSETFTSDSLLFAVARFLLDFWKPLSSL